MTQSLPPKSIILYADDDPDDVLLVAELFNEYSSVVELVTFRNGVELLNYLKHLDPLQPHPCLIILDINMPLMDGKEALKKLRAMKGIENVPVVLFSTSSMPHDESFANRYNAGFITKPLHSAQLHMIVDQMLEYCTSEHKERIKRK